MKDKVYVLELFRVYKRAIGEKNIPEDIISRKIKLYRNHKDAYKELVKLKDNLLYRFYFRGEYLPLDGSSGLGVLTSSDPFEYLLGVDELAVIVDGVVEKRYNAKRFGQYVHSITLHRDKSEKIIKGVELKSEQKRALTFTTALHKELLEELKESGYELIEVD